ncbi:bifunctional DNA-formamidopyrimidine glycosylase/DNA-(apurinic or apyrimidinic site) lyase [Suttonella sp. R2A3]|uniref:bifunctional DNA-formamidopyrimidine glycosylase/DNA-(apurinic or apyrimidinic site) lyase n=1 Tax=Suttonella sp. R2A3 TaxID=2908648 RepID=UPI001F43D5AE|nr:bifunctional DNA-formamidopyrimidine glycosylase/DNA-(apurinic or apyrimidinic site) lyase [Suttonella sp. R2A3]UJF24837.1 bifunctional DNA-formamidopyrimidine glycosylase/DNA-(apurinic or apyrimidinic site) lyase [Suttonella sp. R2A3]
MPELPEVETTRRGLMPLLNQRRIKAIAVRHTALRHPIDEPALHGLEGLSFCEIERRAKYLIIHTTDKTRSLLIHLGMSGSLRVNPLDAPLKKHDHIIIELDNAHSLRYHDPRRFGQFSLINPENPPAYLERLGVEPLDEAFNAEYLFTQCQRRRIAIKALIMDQKVVVGVGNIYANEALFFSKIHPANPARSLSKQAIARLCAEIKQVLLAAIAQGGTTLRDFLHSDGRGGYFQQTLAVYGKHGQPCPNCQRTLEHAVIGGRSSFFCLHCQPKL